MYRSDHIKVLKVLASGLPRRQTFKTKDIVTKAFKRYDSGDRRVRNAYRKIVKEGHAEIIERGVYRLTVSGAALCRRLERAKWRIPSGSKTTTRKRANRRKSAVESVERKTLSSIGSAQTLGL